MTTWAVFSGTRGQEKDEWSRSEHSRRLWKWRSAVYIVGCRHKKHIAVLDNGRSGGLTSPQEAHRRGFRVNLVEAVGGSGE